MPLPPAQPRSQGLSSYRPQGGGKMRDPGNEVKYVAELGAPGDEYNKFPYREGS